MKNNIYGSLFFKFRGLLVIGYSLLVIRYLLLVIDIVEMLHVRSVQL